MNANLLQSANSPEGWVSKHYLGLIKPIDGIVIPSAQSLVESGPEVLDSVLKKVLFRASLRTFSQNNFYSFTGYGTDQAMPHIVVENMRNTRILGIDNSEQSMMTPSELTVRTVTKMPIAQIPLPDGLLGEEILMDRLLNKKYPSPTEHLSRTWFSESDKKARFFRHLAELSLDNLNADPALWRRQESGRNFLNSIINIQGLYDV